jgi:hypothetical protein
MMAYLTRRENFADGSPPPKKPYNALQFKNKTDTLLQGVYGTGKSSNAFLVDLMQKELNKAVEEGVVTMQEGLEFIKSRKKYYDDYLKEQSKTTDGPIGLPQIEEREEFSEGTKTKLVEFVENFKKANGTTPTIMEIARGAKASTTSVRKYLKEGDDFKVTAYIESGKKAGDASAAKKSTGVFEVDQEAFDDLKKITKDIKGISIQTTGTKSKSAGLRIGDQYKELMDTFLDGQKTKYFPADKDGINKLKDLITQIADSPEYQKNVTPFLSSKEKLAIKRAKAAMYKKQDPYGIYRALREYKTEKFPGTMSKDIVIQHGQPKFTTQTLSRFGLIPAEINISPIVEKIEGQRNDLLTKLNQKLKSKNISIEDKKILIEDFNSQMKGLRGQVKGSNAQGLINFELLDIDEKGNIKKLKDVGFNPKKGMAYGSELGDLDLSKITREQADEIIALGKKKIDLELLKKTPNVTTADKVDRPEKAKLGDAFKKFGRYAKQIAKPVVRLAAPFVPFVGPIGVGMGVSDVAEASTFTKKPDDLGIAYLAGPDVAKKYGEFKESVRGKSDEFEEFVP